MTDEPSSFRYNDARVADEKRFGEIERSHDKTLSEISRTKEDIRAIREIVERLERRLESIEARHQGEDAIRRERGLLVRAAWAFMGLAVGVALWLADRVK